MSRLIIISNRLPFTLRESGSTVASTPSSGGLVTALASYIERERDRDPGFESLWVGWPGGPISSELQAQATDVLREQHAAPVFLSQEDGEEFYYGFCNRTLWPLFHYFPSYVDYDPKYWDTYVRVNRSFCDAVSRLLRPGDTVWVHDYHLLLLPAMLRQAHPAACIGFFLHTPFPSHELFRLLPSAWKRELLNGILGADLVGFHVHEYTQYFLQCVLRILGHEHHLGQLAIDDQVHRADTFPLGVDFEKFTSTAESEPVTARTRQIADEMGHRKLIFSVDRLDYTKGIANRLHGYELFLERHPEWQGKVVLLLLVVPSRVEVPQYRELKQELEESVGKINGRFGTLEWVPINYQFRGIPFDELVALYKVADVGLITPLRDGMNLVAKEYLASKPDASGVLILSEMAGAAREMNEAVLVNPNHWAEIADALEQALTMPAAEQARRNQPIRERLQAYDAVGWANHFLSSLARVKEQQGRIATKLLTADLQEQVQREHRAAKRALFLLDYDGTLVPIAARPELASPDPELTSLLSQLARDAHNCVFLVSGRDRGNLERWFGQTGAGLIAEHGAWLREPDGEWRLTRPISPDWKEQVTSFLRMFAAQVAGSLLEEKELSIAWHYRGADPELGPQRAKELIDELTTFTANLALQVIEGKKVVEIRSAGVNKGATAGELALRLEPDFILALGDDQTDEDLFRVLPRWANSVHVGSPFTNARFNLNQQSDVRRLLRKLAQPEAG
jgi:trehalose 6-phosphate synthase/phosphatase